MQDGSKKLVLKGAGDTLEEGMAGGLLGDGLNLVFFEHRLRSGEIDEGENKRNEPGEPKMDSKGTEDLNIFRRVIRDYMGPLRGHIGE